MASWLAIGIVALAVTGLGSVVVLQFLSVKAWRSIDGIFASATLGTVFGGWLALLLAELSVFFSGICFGNLVDCVSDLVPANHNYQRWFGQL